jgi:hypothetical protein
MSWEVVRRQREHWQETYRPHPGMHGDQPSGRAGYAAGVFHGAGATAVLERGSGNRRDALFYAFRIRGSGS